MMESMQKFQLGRSSHEDEEVFLTFNANDDGVIMDSQRLQVICKCDGNMILLRGCRHLQCLD